MTPQERDQHNRSVLVQCNGMGHTAPGPWLPMRRTTMGAYYDPAGSKVVAPVKFRAMTLDEIVAHLARRNEIALAHLKI